MADRRTVLLDAALEIVGTQGMRGLTHRAVDAAAAVPAGSTSNYFRTREALILGIVERFVARERAMATGPREEVDPSPDGVATALGRFVERALGPDRAVTLARYAVLVETAQNPTLREGMAVGADQVDTWALDLVTRAGSQHPERDHGLLANYVTGLVLHELALPSADLDARARIRAVIDTLGWSSTSSLGSHDASLDSHALQT
jgi:AcrR family transcriptional regulator